MSRRWFELVKPQCLRNFASRDLKQEVPLGHGQHICRFTDKQFSIGADLVGFGVDLHVGLVGVELHVGFAETANGVDGLRGGCRPIWAAMPASNNALDIKLTFVAAIAQGLPGAIARAVPLSAKVNLAGNMAPIGNGGSIQPLSIQPQHRGAVMRLVGNIWGLPPFASGAVFCLGQSNG